METTVAEKKTRLLYVDDEAAYRNIFCRDGFRLKPLPMARPPCACSKPVAPTLSSPI